MTMTISGSGTITGLSAGGLPDATITQAELATGVAGTGPAFSAYADATTQTLTSATYTKILFQTEEFDTNSNFASSRFTPTVAGYYQINAQILLGAIGSTCIAAVYKNGVDYKEGSRITIGSVSTSGGPTVSALVYLNGSTDYVEIYGQQASAGSQNLAGTNNQFLNYFQGSMVRAA